MPVIAGAGAISMCVGVAINDAGAPIGVLMGYNAFAPLDGEIQAHAPFLMVDGGAEGVATATTTEPVADFEARPSLGGGGKSSPASLERELARVAAQKRRDARRPQPRRIHHTSRASRTPRASATFMTAPKRVFWPGRASRSWSP